MNRALLFDFNGVLVDDEEQHYESLRSVLAPEGIELSPEQYYADYLGFDDRMSLVEAFRRAQRTPVMEHVERLIAAKSRAYEALIARSLRLVPGALEFVREAARGYRLALVSGALRREIDLVLARAGLASAFEVIVAAEDVTLCKPDPQGYLAAHAALARRNSVPREQCVVIEDSPPGLEAARAAGMRCVMLTTSYPAAAVGGADLVWETFTGHDPEELQALIER